MLRREGLLVVSGDNYYNLRRGIDRGKKLARHKEIAMVMAYLEEEKFHVDVRAEYVMSDLRNRIRDMVVKHIFFVSPRTTKSPAPCPSLSPGTSIRLNLRVSIVIILEATTATVSLAAQKEQGERLQEQ